MAEIGTRKKRTLQEPLQKPSREPVRRLAPKGTPKRKVKAPA